jgi:polyphosphate kinase
MIMPKTKSTKSAAIAKDTPPPFDLDNPRFPKDLDEKSFGSGSYPYEKKLKREAYEEALLPLQTELVKLLAHTRETGARMACLFEGRDTAGKGGCIATIMEHVNPRYARSIALAKPTETEKGQWYFQRYLGHLPSKGELVLFDRSWYNRAGVERVMGFATEDQVANFLREAPELEAMLIRDGLQLHKFFLVIGREMQWKRFHSRRHDPLKQWKLSPIDLAAMAKWDAYTKAQHELFRFTHTTSCPWTVVRANDQRRARLEVLRVILSAAEYAGKDATAIGTPDPKIVGSGPEFFYGE